MEAGVEWWSAGSEGEGDYFLIPEVVEKEWQVREDFSHARSEPGPRIARSISPGTKNVIADRAIRRRDWFKNH
jgi:hypothetical protein